jgi:hypothetical protein
MAQQPGLAVAGVDLALDADDGGDIGTPIGVRELVGRIEDGDGAAFVAVTTDVATKFGSERRRCLADRGNLLEQGGLVVLNLDDQGNVGLRRDLEVFF